MLQKLFTMLVHAVLSLGLLFLALTFSLALVHLPIAWRDNGTVLPLALGFGVGLVVFTLISRFLVLYVFGHELTHFLVAKLFRRKTGRFRTSGRSGSVAVERPNIWITLAPYFVPVYTILWVGIYGITDFIWKDAPAWVPMAFAAGVGVTYSFHVRLTLYALSRQQSDLQRYGKMLSLSFIAFCNVALLYIAALAATGRWNYALEAPRQSAVREWRVAKHVSRKTWFYTRRAKNSCEAMLRGE